MRKSWRSKPDGAAGTLRRNSVRTRPGWKVVVGVMFVALTCLGQAEPDTGTEASDDVIPDRQMDPPATEDPVASSDDGRDDSTPTSSSVNGVGDEAESPRDVWRIEWDLDGDDAFDDTTEERSLHVKLPPTGDADPESVLLHVAAGDPTSVRARIVHVQRRGPDGPSDEVVRRIGFEIVVQREPEPAELAGESDRQESGTDDETGAHAGGSVETAGSAHRDARASIPDPAWLLGVLLVLMAVGLGIATLVLVIVLGRSIIGQQRETRAEVERLQRLRAGPDVSPTEVGRVVRHAVRGALRDIGLAAEPLSGRNAAARPATTGVVPGGPDAARTVGDGHGADPNAVRDSAPTHPPPDVVEAVRSALHRCMRSVPSTSPDFDDARRVAIPLDEVLRSSGRGDLDDETLLAAVRHLNLLARRTADGSREDPVRIENRRSVDGASRRYLCVNEDLP